MEDHPLSLLYELGFTCTVNTDNRLVSGTTMTREFELLAEHCDLELWQLLELTSNALQVAYCDEGLREDLERNVIYPAYAEVGNSLPDEALDAGDAEGTEFSNGMQRLHGHGQPHGAGVAARAGQQDIELSMENLKAELEELGLSLDDEESDGEAGDQTSS